MQSKVQNYILNNKLLHFNDPIIVGVSGGADSVVLLHVLLSLGYDCVVAHCNFHLRTDESDRDEAFVRNMATTLHLPYYCVDFETNKYAKTNSISIEMAARDLRYDWFNTLAIKLNAQAIAVAHHADDSIETMLMNLVRGTGLRGLTGIAPLYKNIARPLLCCTRSDIENYIIDHNLNHITDSSNASLDYKRNKFRNVVLPLLEEINPAVRQTLYTTLSRFEGAFAIYNQAIEKIKNKIVCVENTHVRMNISIIKEQINIPTVLFELLQPYGFNSTVIDQIELHLDSNSGKQFYSDSHRILKDRDYLIISSIDSNNFEEFIIDCEATEIQEPIHLKLSKIDNGAEYIVSKNNKCLSVDAHRIVFPLKLRKWREGDVFYPFGMNKRKKISDFFIDNKFSILDKEHTWLLTSGDDIVWVIGYRPDNRFRITEQTKEVIEFQIVE